MRVVVVYENESERAQAENLAQVLETMAPALAVDAQTDGQRGITIRHGLGSRPKVLVRAQHIRDTPPSSVEHQEYVAALERSVFGFAQ